MKLPKPGPGTPIVKGGYPPDEVEKELDSLVNSVTITVLIMVICACVGIAVLEGWL